MVVVSNNWLSGCLPSSVGTVTTGLLQIVDVSFKVHAVPVLTKWEPKSQQGQSSLLHNLLVSGTSTASQPKVLPTATKNYCTSNKHKAPTWKPQIRSTTYQATLLAEPLCCCAVNSKRRGRLLLPLKTIGAIWRVGGTPSASATSRIATLQHEKYGIIRYSNTIIRLYGCRTSVRALEMQITKHAACASGL